MWLAICVYRDLKVLSYQTFAKLSKCKKFELPISPVLQILRITN